MKKILRLTGIVLLIIILLKIDLSKLAQTFTNLNVFILIPAILLNIPHIFIKSFRWNQLLSRQSIQYDLGDAFLVYLSSIYTGIITPGRLGEFIKAVYLKADKGVSLSRGMSSVLLDRIFDLYILIFLGIFGIWQLDIFGKLTNIFFILIVFVCLVPLLILNEELMKKILGLIYRNTIVKKVKKDFKEKYEDFYYGVNQLLNIKLIYSVLLTCISYLIYFIQCYLIVIAMDIPINFITITMFMAISNVISFIPVSISGLGTRDATLIYFFSLIGLSAELAVSYAFIVFITFFVCGGLAGMVAWWIKPLDINLRGS